MARWWPIREVCLLSLHIMVSFLKAWKVTLVGIECGDAAFLTLFKSTTEIVLSRKTRLLLGCCCCFRKQSEKLELVDSYKYQVSLLTCVIACKLGNSVFFLFFPQKYGVGESEKKKK